MDLAFVDKLASQYIGVKYLLVAVVFSRLYRFQPMKIKNSKDTLKNCCKSIPEKL